MMYTHACGLAMISVDYTEATSGATSGKPTWNPLHHIQSVSYKCKSSMSTHKRDNGFLEEYVLVFYLFVCCYLLVIHYWKCWQFLELKIQRRHWESVSFCSLATSTSLVPFTLPQSKLLIGNKRILWIFFWLENEKLIEILTLNPEFSVLNTGVIPVSRMLRACRVSMATLSNTMVDSRVIWNFYAHFEENILNKQTNHLVPHLYVKVETGPFPQETEAERTRERLNKNTNFM